MISLLLLNKPFGVMSQFRKEAGQLSLADYINITQIYPAGRLDKDSEGLLLLTNDGHLQHQISHPKHKQAKTYWVQVEGEITDAAITQLEQGVTLKDGPTRPATARRLVKPDIWPRDPPIRYRANIPTSWLELTIKEGRNRQVRRMTAAVGFPTLRLIRYQIGTWTLDGLQPGEWRMIDLTPTQLEELQLARKPARHRGRRGRT